MHPPVQWVPGLFPGVTSGQGVALTTDPLDLHGLFQGELHLYLLPFSHRIGCNMQQVL